MEQKTYDVMVACVERDSGWIVAVPCQRKGLTGAGVAQKMLKHQWQLFGLPNVITSDQGSHFLNAWFGTLAAALGVRQAFSHAYHHQANGRIKRAGQQLMEHLRKIKAEKTTNWVEAMPAALRQIHDAPGESGLSPYQIMFGRQRNLPNA